MQNSDVFVLLDNAQYSKNNYINRVKLEVNLQYNYCTLPVKGSSLATPICEVQISNAFKPNKILNTIKQSYSKYEYVKEEVDLLNNIFNYTSSSLSEFNINALTVLKDYLDLNVDFVLASRLSNIESKNTDRILDICKELGATKYITGAGGLSYIKKSDFDSSGIDIVLQQHANAQSLVNPDEGVLSILHFILKYGRDYTMEFIGDGYEAV